jgi:hypothetical protein
MHITHNPLTAISMLTASLKMVPPTASAKPASICAESPIIGPDGGSEQTTRRASRTRYCLDMARKPPILGARASQTRHPFLTTAHPSPYGATPRF